MDIPRESWVLVAQPSGDWSRMRILPWPRQDQLRCKSNKSVGNKWDKYRPGSGVPHSRIRESAWRLEGFTALTTHTTQPHKMKFGDLTAAAPGK
jgi:hypothetical protein